VCGGRQEQEGGITLRAGGSIVWVKSWGLSIGAKFLSHLSGRSGYTQRVRVRSSGTSRPGVTPGRALWEIKLER
jgi:hypothetical protein